MVRRSRSFLVTSTALAVLLLALSASEASAPCGSYEESTWFPSAQDCTGAPRDCGELTVCGPIPK